MMDEEEGGDDDAAMDGGATIVDGAVAVSDPGRTKAGGLGIIGCTDWNSSATLAVGPSRCSCSSGFLKERERDRLDDADGEDDGACGLCTGTPEVGWTG